MTDSVRVLVVDDVEDLATTLAAWLKLDGYEVRFATNGPEALAAAQDFMPECVLLDIDMPGTGGIEVARQLRELHGHNLVLVAITGWGDEGLRVSNLFADFDHYMRKPVGLAALNKLLPPLG